MLDQKGQKRSLKSIHPAQTEGEGDGFGTREDKEATAVLQRNAWDKNTKFLTPLFTAISAPLEPKIRERGEVGRTSAKQMEASARRECSQRTRGEQDAFKALVNRSESKWVKQTESALAIT